jgi:hypothetical protein
VGCGGLLQKRTTALLALQDRDSSGEPEEDSFPLSTKIAVLFFPLAQGAFCFSITGTPPTRVLLIEAPSLAV